MRRRNAQYQDSQSTLSTDNSKVRAQISDRATSQLSEMDDAAKGCLTQFYKLFTVILWALKDFKR